MLFEPFLRFFLSGFIPRLLHIPRSDTLNTFLLQFQVTDFPDVWPRHFSIRPDGKSLWLVEQHKNLLQEWIIDQENGSVTLGQEVTLTNNPAFVLEV